MNVLLNSQDYDALLVIHSPSAAAPGTESALALIDALKHHPRGKYVTVLTNWCGEFSSQEARRLFSDAGLPTYRTPEGTITAFMHMVEYRRNQKQLRETPVLPDSLTANTSEAHALLQQAIDDAPPRWILTRSARCFGLWHPHAAGLPLTARKRCISLSR
ncbi:acetate--CoA ligase family protein [Klebsiella pneumoniae]|nr:acetate--CoA ligase family protein [Klebsiella pneumoniae]